MGFLIMQNAAMIVLFATTRITGWINDHQQAIQLLSSLYILFFVLTIFALVFVVITLPKSYFTRDYRQSASRSKSHPLFWQTLGLCKNLLGFLLILVGVALLVLPGQGALTILVGLTMVNFPGKYRLERKLISQPAINKTLNSIRKLAKRPLLEIPD